MCFLWPTDTSDSAGSNEKWIGLVPPALLIQKLKAQCRSLKVKVHGLYYADVQCSSLNALLNEQRGDW